MINNWHGIGNLTKDPEQRSTQTGKTVCNFSIAINQKFGDKETTEFVNCVAWGKLAEICGNYLTKGKQVYVSGRLQTRKWETKEGATRYSTEIVADQMQMLGGKGQKPQDEPQKQQQATEPEDESPF